MRDIAKELNTSFGSVDVHFQTDAKVQDDVIKWLNDQSSDFFNAGFDTLVYRWNKYFDSHGGYVAK